MPNPYAPVERALESITGRVERAGERRYEHAGRMGELGLIGKRFGIERERLDLEKRAKLPDILKAEEDKRRREERKAKLAQVSKLSDRSTYEDVVGLDPDGKKWKWLEEIVPEAKHIKPEGVVIGFNVLGREVPDAMQRIRGKMGPADVLGQIEMLEKTRTSLIERGAQKGGTDEYSEKLRAVDEGISKYADVLKDTEKGGLDAFLYKMQGLGAKGLTKAQIERADRYRKKLEAEAQSDTDKLLRAQVSKIDDQIKAIDDDINRTELEIAKKDPMVDDLSIARLGQEKMRLMNRRQTLYGYKTALGASVPKGFLPGETKPSLDVNKIASGTEGELGLSGKESPKPGTSLKKVRGKVLSKKTPISQNLTLDEAVDTMVKAGVKATRKQILKTAKKYSTGGQISQENLEAIARDLGLWGGYLWEETKALGRNLRDIGKLRVPLTGQLREPLPEGQ